TPVPSKTPMVGTASRLCPLLSGHRKTCDESFNGSVSARSQTCRLTAKEPSSGARPPLTTRVVLVISAGAPGQTAPSLTQFTNEATCLSVNLDLGGISRSPPRRTALISKLASGSPGTTIGPDSPPLLNPSPESSLSPPFCFSGPWHLTHCAKNIGRT